MRIGVLARICRFEPGCLIIRQKLIDQVTVDRAWRRGSLTAVAASAGV